MSREFIWCGGFKLLLAVEFFVVGIIAVFLQRTLTWSFERGTDKNSKVVADMREAGMGDGPVLQGFPQEPWSRV